MMSRVSRQRGASYRLRSQPAGPRSLLSTIGSVALVCALIVLVFHMHPAANTASPSLAGIQSVSARTTHLIDDVDMTIIENTLVVRQGTKQCYFQYVEDHSIINFAFGGSMASFWDQSVGFEIYTPKGLLHKKGVFKSAATVEVPQAESGEWKVCISNRVSATTKKVLLSIEVDRPVAPPASFNKKRKKFGSAGSDDPVDATASKEDDSPLQTILEQLDRLQRELNKMANYQSEHRRRLTRHIDTQAFSNSQVQTTSIIEILALIGISIGQVLFVKYLFSTMSGNSGKP